MDIFIKLNIVKPPILNAIPSPHVVLARVEGRSVGRAVVGRNYSLTGNAPRYCGTPGSMVTARASAERTRMRERYIEVKEERPREIEREKRKEGFNLNSMEAAPLF